VSEGRWQGRPDRPSRKFKEKKYRNMLKDRCERCAFLPEDICQLDIHHLDQNHENDDPSNLQTLCANCHRFITKLEKQKARSLSRPGS
jgi:hypothetical protein